MFFIPILFQLLPTLIYSQIYCDLCGYEFRGDKEEITLNDVHPTSTSVSTNKKRKIQKQLKPEKKERNTLKICSL